MKSCLLLSASLALFAIMLSIAVSQSRRIAVLERDYRDMNRVLACITGTQTACEEVNQK